MKPCPFCSSRKVEIVTFHQRGEHYLVRCKTCGAKGPFDYERTGAIEKWNRRGIAGVVPFKELHSRMPHHDGQA